MQVWRVSRGLSVFTVLEGHIPPPPPPPHPPGGESFHCQTHTIAWGAEWPLRQRLPQETHTYTHTNTHSWNHTHTPSTDSRFSSDSVLLMISNKQFELNLSEMCGICWVNLMYVSNQIELLTNRLTVLNIREGIMWEHYLSIFFMLN